jgi:hypothetical protein
MHVLQFLDRLIVIPNIEVVIPPLPELYVSKPLEPSRNLLLQDLQRQRKRYRPRLANKQMHMLRHDHISGYNETMSLPDLFKLFLENTVSEPIRKQRLPLITTENDKVIPT